VVDPVGIFEEQRKRLFGLAYRLLGSAKDAEDVVQDAYIRWNGTDPTSIANPPAWLTKVVTNLSLNQLASATKRREHYVGTWSPEPVLTTDGALGPLETAEQRNSVSLALLTLMERLTPSERVVFVLHESFDYSHREIALILDLSEANCRQLNRRARQRLGQQEDRFRPKPEEWRHLVERFLAAAATGDVAALETLLAEGVTYWGDGGGKAPVAKHPVSGRVRVARFFAKVVPHYSGDPRYANELGVFVVAEVNGELALLGRTGDNLLVVLAPEMADGRIAALRVMANPDKLSFAGGQGQSLSHCEPLSGQFI
jgi:RNA polymerase sigma factor (sigma-70 family)